MTNSSARKRVPKNGAAGFSYHFNGFDRVDFNDARVGAGASGMAHGAGGL